MYDYNQNDKKANMKNKNQIIISFDQETFI